MKARATLLVCAFVLVIASLLVEPAGASYPYCNDRVQCPTFGPAAPCTCPPGTWGYPMETTCGEYVFGLCDA